MSQEVQLSRFYSLIEIGNNGQTIVIPQFYSLVEVGSGSQTVVIPQFFALIEVGDPPEYDNPPPAMNIFGPLAQDNC